MRFPIADFLFILWLLVVSGPARALVLSEIMFNPDGDESCDEFVELYNDSTNVVDLRGWRISDGIGTDSIIGLEQGTHVLPGQYVLILDPDYFANGSTTYDGMIPANAIVVTINNSTFGDRGLANGTAERVSLIHGQSDTASFCEYTVPNDQGYSEEKIIPNGGDTPSNWTNSLRHHGTPGGPNSVTPPDHDLSIVALYSEPSFPGVADNFSVFCTVKNVGRLPHSDSLFLRDVSNAPIESTSVGRWRTSVLAPGDSASFVARLQMGETGVCRLLASLAGADDRAENDRLTLTVSAAGTSGAILINEIMFAPEPQRAEWVELVNASMFGQSLSGWRFGDGTAMSDTSHRFRLPDVVLGPGGFAVLASDSSIFFEGVPPSVPILVWRGQSITLNNNGDSLLLWSADGNVIERVDYRPSWGNGVPGFSIERISMQSASNDPLNWASSLDSTGSTPGRSNSRALAPGADSDNLLTLEPNPFSPDGDGREDVLAIRYRLSHADSRVDVKVYDVRGREVRRLANNAPAGYTGEILWDGTDEAGRRLATGIYIVYLEALGKGGIRVQSARRVVALARPS